NILNQIFAKDSFDAPRGRETIKRPDTIPLQSPPAADPKSAALTSTPSDNPGSEDESASPPDPRLMHHGVQITYLGQGGRSLAVEHDEAGGHPKRVLLADLGVQSPRGPTPDLAVATAPN
ncbi:hypothetical protein, partial [Actinomycetospora sp. NBRC 106375]|uniref:hypothetical protein n=1 Tax=Actinomycetospora sp. NBRC 106375 TaxID=3032207 RepID=UPI0025555AF8